MTQAIILLALALVFFIITRKSVRRAAARKSRKLAKSAALALVKLAWAGIKALGREVRAQASWLPA